MHNLMSYFFGTKLQMTTALLWYRNCCSFSHPYRTPWEPWGRSTSVLRCSCKWHSSSQLQASNCTSNQWQKFLSLMRFLITIHFFMKTRSLSIATRISPAEIWDTSIVKLFSHVPAVLIPPAGWNFPWYWGQACYVWLSIQVNVMQTSKG